LDVAIISAQILSLPAFLIFACNIQHNEFKLIYAIYCISFLLYLILGIFSKVLSFRIRFFSIAIIWCIVCIGVLFDTIYIYSSQTGLIFASLVLAGVLLFGIKKIQRTYPIAIEILEKQSQDISISKLRQKESEMQYMNLFNNMLDAFAIHELILDTDNNPKDYRFLLVNPVFESMTGLKGKDIIGKTVREVLPETEQYWIDTYSQVALTGEAIRFEHYSRELDSYFEVCAYCPEPGQFACIFQNITRRKKAEYEQQELENQLRQSHKMEALGTLAGGVAHDFNNLLMPIMGYTEMLLDDFSNNQDAVASLSEILKAASRAKNLAEQILTFSRCSKIQNTSVDVVKIIEETIPLLRSIIPKSIEIRQDIEKNGHVVIGDPSQFQQIIMNLCTNAYHAIDKDNGFIFISLHKKHMDEFHQWNGEHLPSGQYIVLSISDNGKGITSETQERIFDPYFTTKEKGKGTGLGLSMVLGIVNRFNGGISLKSEIGIGTCFEIYIPVIQADSNTEENNNKAPIVSGSERILLVEDEEAILEIEKKMLQRMGYSVTACINSLDAKACFEKSPDSFDLVISDLTMPNISGDKLAIELTQIRPDIPVIICTGYSERESDLSHKPGVRALLTKPILKKELAGAIRRVLNGE
jgi:PAS domain S-box-containing protein